MFLMNNLSAQRRATMLDIITAPGFLDKAGELIRANQITKSACADSILARAGGLGAVVAAISNRLIILPALGCVVPIPRCV